MSLNLADACIAERAWLWLSIVISDEKPADNYLTSPRQGTRVGGMETRLDRIIDRQIADENARYLAWRAEHEEEARADDEAMARRVWKAVGWCEECGDPDHTREYHR